MSSSSESCKLCCNYNLNRLKYYTLIAIVTIGIMVGVDYGLKNGNKCFNTYYMFAQLFNPKGSYPYLCHQDEILYSLAVAIILMLTFHALFAMIVFHIIQSIYFKQKGIGLNNAKTDKDKPYHYHSPSYNTKRKSGVELGKKRNSNGKITDAIGGRSSDFTDEDMSHASDQMLPSQRRKNKQVRKQKNKKYGPIQQHEEDGEGYDST